MLFCVDHYRLAERLQTQICDWSPPTALVSLKKEITEK